MADMTACRNIGRGPSMFYSFGVPTVQARTKFRDTVQPRPIMFNDALPDTWSQAVGKVTRFELDMPITHVVLAQRISTALAKLSEGEVFLVVKNRQGDHGGVGAYQLPDPNDNLINVWRDYEFPALQRNSCVTKVTCVALTDDLQRHTDWEPNNPAQYEPLPEVALLPDPDTADNKKRAASKKGGQSCKASDAPSNALLKKQFTAVGGKLPNSSNILGPQRASSTSGVRATAVSKP